MTTARLSAPRLRVVLDNPGGDMTEVIVQADNRDLVRWDVTRARKGWPEFSDAMFLWSTFLAWSVMHREGHTTLKLDDFLDTCVQASPVPADDAENPDTDDDDGSTVGPTRPALESA